MKFLHVFIILSIGLLTAKAEDEVTDISNSESSIDSVKDDSQDETSIDSMDTSKNVEDSMHEQNDIEKRLPSDYQSIREKIADSKFNCKDHEPGYYADIENDCQIFHHCAEGRSETFSFICPLETMFSQRNLVCVWRQARENECESSADFYEESNRNFNGNSTASMSIEENRKNSTEVTDMEVEDISTDTKNDAMSEDIKLMEIADQHDLESTNEESSMIEKNSIEEKVETVEEETEENEFQAELIPSLYNGPDASIASSHADEIIENHPQKITFSIIDPIIEMPSNDDDQLQTTVEVETEATRNIRKRSGNHRNRFLFKADAH